MANCASDQFPQDLYATDRMVTARCGSCSRPITLRPGRPWPRGKLHFRLFLRPGRMANINCLSGGSGQLSRGPRAHGHMATALPARYPQTCTLKTAEIRQRSRPVTHSSTAHSRMCMHTMPWRRQRRQRGSTARRPRTHFKRNYAYGLSLQR